MSKYDKKLKKALAQFENGNYEEALDICEKVLDKDYNNEEALTLEARVLEKLNRISDAIVSWKINAEYNNNEEARIKLDKFSNIDEKKLAMSTIFSETMKDEIKARLQEEAQKEYAKQLEKRETEIKPLKEEEIKKPSKEEVDIENIKSPKEEIKIKEETILKDKDEPKKEIFKDVEIEDIKIDEPIKEEAPKLDNVTKVDFNKKHNKKGKHSTNNSKDDEPKVISTPNFKNEKSNSKKSNKKKPVKYIAIAVSGAIVLLLAYGVTKNIKNTNATKAPVASSEQANQNNTTNNNSENKTEESKKDTKPLTSEEINKAIENNDMNSLYTLLTSTKEEDVPKDALDAYKKGEELMKNEGVKDFYLKGSDLFKEGKYEDAIKDFEKAYTFSSNSYLRPHLIYFMGTSYEKLDNNKEAIKYFKEYLDDYKAKPDAEDLMYTPQCLYDLAIIYDKEGNKEEAKKYAKELEDDYPNTMFYNDVTKEIIYGK